MAEVNEVVSTEEPAAKTYTEEEVQALVSKGINGALAKYKEKATKTTDQRVAELEAELARRDLADKVKASLKENNISEDLTSLFTGDDYENRIETFKAWYDSAIETAVKEKIGGTHPISLTTPTPSTKKDRPSLAEIAAKYE